MNGAESVIQFADRLAAARRELAEGCQFAAAAVAGLEKAAAAGLSTAAADADLEADAESAAVMLAAEIDRVLARLARLVEGANRDLGRSGPGNTAYTPSRGRQGRLPTAYQTRGDGQRD
jgi:hypothetical protein